MGGIPHSPYKSQSSFSNLSVTSPTSQLILQPYRRFTYVTAHSTILPLLHIRHRLFTYVTWRASFSNPFVASPTSQFIIQPFRCFTYVTGNWSTSSSESHSPTLSSLHLRHSSFSFPSVASPTSQLILNHSVASPTSQALRLRHLASLILQHFLRFTYDTALSPSLPSPHLRRSSFFNHSVASPTSQALHLRHLASRPCSERAFDFYCLHEGAR